MNSYFTNQILDDVFNCERIRNYIYAMYKLRLINRNEVYDIELQLRELNTYDVFIYDDGPPHWMDQEDPSEAVDHREERRRSRIKASTYSRLQDNRIKQQSTKRSKPRDSSS